MRAIVVTTLGLISIGLLPACQEPAKPAPTAEKAEAEKKPEPTPGKPDVVKPSTPSEPATPASDAAGESDGSTRLGEPPAWFTPDAIEHEKVIKQDKAETKLAGGFAAAIVLQLKDGTTAEDCMTKLKAKVGETVSDLGEATPGPGGRLTLHGTASGYQYTLVCGAGKDGKPTAYMSYSTE